MILNCNNYKKWAIILYFDMYVLIISSWLYFNTVVTHIDYEKLIMFLYTDSMY